MHTTRRGGVETCSAVVHCKHHDANTTHDAYTTHFGKLYKLIIKI